MTRWEEFYNLSRPNLQLMYTTMVLFVKRYDNIMVGILSKIPSFDDEYRTECVL